jgi:hypothetical protein
LGELVLKTDSTQPVDLILSGTDENLDYLEERVTLTVMERVVIPAHFQTLAYLQTGQPAQGKIAVHSTVLNETITAYPLDWHNIWLYGMKILFAGALNVREMRRLMTLNLRKSAANQKIKIAELKPLSEFFP